MWGPNMRQSILPTYRGEALESERSIRGFLFKTRLVGAVCFLGGLSLTSVAVPMLVHDVIDFAINYNFKLVNNEVDGTFNLDANKTRIVAEIALSLIGFYATSMSNGILIATLERFRHQY